MPFYIISGSVHIIIPVKTLPDAKVAVAWAKEHLPPRLQGAIMAQHELPELDAIAFNFLTIVDGVEITLTYMLESAYDGD